MSNHERALRLTEQMLLFDTQERNVYCLCLVSRTTSSSVACIEVRVIKNREDIVSFQIQILGVLFTVISKKVSLKKNMKGFFNLTDFFTVQV